jgi:hypothetical protein
MIQNSNKITKEVSFLMSLYSSLCAIHFITTRAHNDYNIKAIEDIIDKILVILCVEMRL